MTKLKLVGFALVFSFGLGACGSAADDIKKLAKEACACKDKACGEAVNKKIEAALEKIESESEAKEAISAMGEAAVCLGKLGVN
jgi:hypothetical protein